MHIRMNTITGVTDVDGGIRVLRETAIPELQNQRGFRGLLVSEDRANRSVAVLSLWDTEQDLHASESAAAKVRSETLGVIGGDVNVEVFEQVVGEYGDPPPTEGCSLRVRRLRMDPGGSVDEATRHFVTQWLPRLKAAKGFRGVRVMVDRDTGNGVIGTLWSDEESMRAAEPMAEEGLRDAASRGVQVTSTNTRVVRLHHLT